MRLTLPRPLVPLGGALSGGVPRWRCTGLGSAIEELAVVRAHRDMLVTRSSAEGIASPARAATATAVGESVARRATGW